MRGRRVEAVLDDHLHGDDAPTAFAVELVTGVDAHRAELDASLATLARDWTIDRMPVVDRNVLRLGLFELRHTDVPPGVAISQAVELASDLSTDDSARYVNGVLAKAAEQLAASRDAS